MAKYRCAMDPFLQLPTFCLPLQSHPFFDGIDWDNLYSTQAPHQPTVKHALDTQNFEKFDEQAAAGLNPGCMKRWARADPNFVGYTYKNWEAVQPGAHDSKRSPVANVLLLQLCQLKPGAKGNWAAAPGCVTFLSHLAVCIILVLFAYEVWYKVSIPAVHCWPDAPVLSLTLMCFLLQQVDACS